MSKTAHTPLRLSAGDELRIMDWFNNPICDIKCGGMSGRTVADGEEIAATMVARWNALEGIPDPSVVGEAIGLIRDAAACLGDLFCDQTVGEPDPDEDPLIDILRRSRAILAKLEGGEA